VKVIYEGLEDGQLVHTIAGVGAESWQPRGCSYITRSYLLFGQALRLLARQNLQHRNRTYRRTISNEKSDAVPQYLTTDLIQPIASRYIAQCSVSSR
jgi:hypothetical protein